MEKTGTGKTYNVMSRRDLNVYRVTGYEHPFDKYLHEDTLLFDEFRSQLPISDMLIYLDGYRKTFLSARYNPKTALYNKVFIISNVSLEEQYQDVQRTSPESWDAFLRRIDHVERYVGFGEVEVYKSVDDYFAGKCQFHKITPNDIAENPFTKGGDSCA